MKLTRTCFTSGLILSFLMAANHLSAQTLSLSPSSIDSLTHSYPGMGMGGDDQQSFTFGTPSVDLINFNTVQVSVNAPAGEAWNIAYNGEGLSSASLNFNLSYNNSFSTPWATITGGSLQFNYVNGSSASLTSFSNNQYAMPDSGDRFDMSLGYNVVGDLSFTSFTAIMTYDNSTLATAALSAFANSRLDYQYQPSNPSAPDPGALLTLQAVPEPSMMAFIGLSGLGAIMMVRRRLQKS